MKILLSFTLLCLSLSYENSDCLGCSSAGDSYCDKNCMSPFCNYDSKVQIRNSEDMLKFSDCRENCSSVCEPEKLGDSACDPECNIPECSFDFGDCGECSSGCFSHMLGNGSCEDECNTSLCNFDYNDCGWCNEGCFKDDFEKGTCKTECNTQNCNFDKNFCAPESTNTKANSREESGLNCNLNPELCFCAEGCYPEILGQTFCLENDPCNTHSCNYKNWICESQCAPGCTESMLGNGQCDEACQVSSCYYDLEDCLKSCATGCDISLDLNYDGTSCDPWKCMVPECRFNMGRNSSKECNYYTEREILNYIINKNFKSLDRHKEFTQRHAYELSGKETCTGCPNHIELSSDKRCQDVKDQCASKECLYCMGYIDCPAQCERCEVSGKCLKCSGSQVYDICLLYEKCPPGFSFLGFGSFENLCVANFQNSTSNFPAKIYVNAAENPQLNGTGTMYDPYNSLGYAFAKVWERYTKIILMPGKHYFEQNTYKELENELVASLTNPLSRLRDPGFLSIEIESYNPLEPATILFSDNKMTLSTFSKKLLLRNLVVDGSTGLVAEPCGYSSCEYCPKKHYEGCEVFDDRGNPKNSSWGESCDLNSESVAISSENSKKLILENILIQNFRKEYKAIIYSKGEEEIILKNVTFYNVKTADSPKNAAVILIEGTKNSNSGNFTYNYGKVTLLNNGFEYDRAAKNSGFFLGKHLNNFLAQKVEFSYNSVTSPTDSSIDSSLILIENSIGKIKFEECLFNTILSTNLIYIDSSSIEYQNLTIDRNGVIEQFKQAHLILKNVQIKNVHSFKSIMSHQMHNIAQNVLIYNVSIENCYSGGNSMLSVEDFYLKNSSDSDYGVSKSAEGCSYNQTTGIVPKNLVLIAFFRATNCFFKKDLFRLKSLSNVHLSSVEVTNSGGSTKDLINEMVVSRFISNPDSYYSLKIDSSSLPELTCQKVFDLIDLYEVVIENIKIGRIQCRSDLKSSMIYLEDVLSDITIENLNISFIEVESDLGASIHASNKAKNFKILNYVSQNITNHLGSINYINNLESLTVQNVGFQTIIGSVSGSFTVLKVKNTKFENVTCFYCATSGDGAFLDYLQYEAGPSDLKIKNSYMIGCNAQVSRGCFYLVKDLSNNLLSFNMENVTVKDSYSYAGSFLCMAFVSFNESVISDVFLENLYTHKGGPIEDFHLMGTVKIKNLHQRNITGEYCTIRGGYITGITLVVLEDSSFKHCICKKDLFKIESLDEVGTIEIRNITIEDSTYLFSFFNSYLKISNSAFSRNLKGIEVANQGNAELSNVNFQHNKGVSISILSGSSLDAKNCSFYENDSTVVYSTQNSFFKIFNCNFTKNKNNGSGSALVLTDSLQKNEISNSSFTENFSKNSFTLDLRRAFLSVAYCNFSKNKATKMSPGIGLLESTLHVFDSKFKNQSAETGSFLYLTTNSEIIIHNSAFEEGRSSLQGGAMGAYLSKVEIYNSYFKGFQAESGGLIWGLNRANISIIDTTIEYATASKFGGLVYSNEGILIIRNCSVRNANGSALYLLNQEALKVSNSSFELCSGKDGGVVFSSNVGSIEISNSLFSNNTAEEKGGSIYLENNLGSSLSYCKLDSSDFYNNSARFGGAVHFDTVPFLISFCNFSQNWANSSGGAIQLGCKGSETCKSEIRQSYFGSNLAKIEGGAIKWQETKPELKEVKFTRNNAIYGRSISSYPVGIRFEASNKTSKKSENSHAIEVVPGKQLEESITFSLVDHYGNIVVLDTSSIATLTSLDNDVSISGQTKVQSNQGKFTFDKVTISATPGSTVEINIQCDQIPETRSNYSSSITLSVHMRYCKMGEYKESVSCIECKNGSYSLDPSQKCTECPNGAICEGSWKMYPRKGYWRYSTLTDVFYKCPIDGACLGSIDKQSYTGICEEGYRGNLCHSCNITYSKSFDGSCRECPNQGENFLVLLLLVAVILLGSFLLIKSTIKSAYEPKSLYSIYFKIFMNYLQVIYLTTQFNLSWPYLVFELFKIQKAASNVIEQIFSLECFLETKDYDFHKEAVFLKAIIMSLAPIIIAVIAAAFWGVVSVVKKNKSVFRNELFATILILFLLVHPFITKAMFSLFACTEIEGTSGYWLNENLDLECWSEKHYFYAFGVALPSIILWSILLPAVFLVLVIKRKKSLEKQANKIRFGFLVNGYNRTQFYWEFIILYRKVFITSLAVFFSTISIRIQAILCLSVLICSLYVQVRFWPFQVFHLNLMETFAISTSTITIYSGLFFLSGDLEKYSEFFFFLMICIANLCFLGFWIWHLSKTSIRGLAPYIGFLRRRYFREDGFDKELFVSRKLSSKTYMHGNQKLCSFIDSDHKKSRKNFRLPSLTQVYKEMMYAEEQQ